MSKRAIDPTARMFGIVLWYLVWILFSICAIVFGKLIHAEAWKIGAAILLAGVVILVNIDWDCYD